MTGGFVPLPLSCGGEPRGESREPMLYSRVVPEPVVEIPNRPAFRASEVCELAQIPPYVLKSWEKEFPGLGVAPKPGAPRIYRRSDVEQVLHIKELLFKHGMTLAGARRKLEGEPKVEEEPLPELPVAGEVREKVGRIKQELRSLLDMLSVPAREGRRDEPMLQEAAPRVAPIEGAGVEAERAPWPSRGEQEEHGLAAKLRRPAEDQDEQGVAPKLQRPAEDQDEQGVAPELRRPAEDQDEQGVAAKLRLGRQREEEPSEELPLLEGVPERAVDPPKPVRRPRRGSRPADRGQH